MYDQSKLLGDQNDFGIQNNNLRVIQTSGEVSQDLQE